MDYIRQVVQIFNIHNFLNGLQHKVPALKAETAKVKDRFAQGCSSHHSRNEVGPSLCPIVGKIGDVPPVLEDIMQVLRLSPHECIQEQVTER